MKFKDTISCILPILTMSVGVAMGMPISKITGEIALTVGFATVAEMLKALAGNWFSDTAKDLVGKQLGNQKNTINGDLSRAIGRAFEKTFNALADSYASSEAYTKLRSSLGEEVADYPTVKLQELAKDSSLLFHEQVSLQLVSAESESFLKERLGRHSSSELSSPHQLLQVSLREYLVDCAPTAIEYICGQGTTNELIERFKDELKDPEKGTEAWRAWQMLQYHDINYGIGHIIDLLQELPLLSHEIAEIKNSLHVLLERTLVTSTNALEAFPWQITEANPHRELYPPNRDKVTTIEEKLLSDRRLCVISGMPGSGKKFLARYIGNRLREQFPNGGIWATMDEWNLRDSNSQTRLLPILRQIAIAYNHPDLIPDTLSLPAAIGLVSRLIRGKKTLLVVNNVQTTADIDELRKIEGPRSLLITTSVRLLDIDPSTSVVLEQRDDDEIVDYLIRSTEQADTFSEAERKAAESIVKLVGGNPFALTLIASYIRFGITSTRKHRKMSFRNFLRLMNEENILNLLVDVNDPNKSIKALLELSYRRLCSLSNEAGKLFEYLGSFDSSEVSLAALVAASNLSFIKVLRLQSYLESTSMAELLFLNIQNDIEDEEFVEQIQSRIVVNELVRVFAREKLGSEFILAQQRLLDYLVLLSEKYELQSYRLLEAEWEVIHKAVEWAFANNHIEQAKKIVLHLSQPFQGTIGFLDVRAYWKTGLEWTNKLLQQEATMGNLQKAWLLLRMAIFSLRQDDYPRSEALALQGIALIDASLQDSLLPLCEAYLCDVCAWVCERTESLESAFPWAQRAYERVKTSAAMLPASENGYFGFRLATIAYRSEIPLSMSAEDLLEQALQSMDKVQTSARVSILMALGNILVDQGKIEDAENRLYEAIELARQIGNDLQVARCYSLLAEIREQQDDLTTGEEYYYLALPIMQRSKSIYGEAALLNNLADLYIRKYQYALALTTLEQAWNLSQKYDLQEVKFQVMINRVQVHIEQKQWIQAHDLLEMIRNDEVAYDDSSYLEEMNQLWSIVSDNLIGNDEI